MKRFCTAEWACGNWSACDDGKQVRECGKINSCEDVSNKPQEQKGCHLVTSIRENSVNLTVNETEIPVKIAGFDDTNDTSAIIVVSSKENIGSFNPIFPLFFILILIVFLILSHSLHQDKSSSIDAKT